MSNFQHLAATGKGQFTIPAGWAVQNLRIELAAGLSLTFTAGFSPSYTDIVRDAELDTTYRYENITRFAIQDISDDYVIYYDVIGVSGGSANIYLSLVKITNIEQSLVIAGETLIDSTYFINDINLPDSQYFDVQQYINRWEPEILKLLLGYELYQYVKDYDQVSSDQRIKDLVEGATYTVGDVEVHWNGLANIDKLSLIAYYVYVKTSQIHNSLMMQVGNVKPTQENSTPQSIAYKVSAAWNEMIDLYGSPDTDKYIPSAYNFITEHIDDYPEWKFTEQLGKMNQWGI